MERSLARNPGTASTGWPSPRGARSNRGESNRLALSSNMPLASASSRPRPGGRSRATAAGGSLRSSRMLFLVVRFLVRGARTAEPRHRHEHVLKLLGDLGIEVEPALHQRFRRDLFDVANHLLLESVHDSVLHWLHIGKSEKLPGFLRCAIYLHVYFHLRS